MNGFPVTDSVLLIRAVDAGSTFMSFRWLDDPTNPTVHAIEERHRNRILGLLNKALVTADGAEGNQGEAVRQALSGPFTRFHSEYAVSEALSRAILPPAVVRELMARAERGSVSVRITISGELSRVPFELLLVDDEQRLIEIADLCYEPPAAIHVGRGRIPEVWTEGVSERSVLYVVDPALPAGSGMLRILGDPAAQGPSNRQIFIDHIAARPHTWTSGVGKPLGRWELSEELRALPSRLFYFGHVSSTLDQPGSASLHLYDDEQEWGLAAPVNHAHLPLSALDLLLGTAAVELGPEDRAPLEPDQPGHRLWPMPARVAVIACEGGVDYRSSETFGLVMAILSSGAEILATTRWTLPSDAAFAELAGVTRIPGPTTELALAVDEMQAADNPAAALSRWQRAKLEQWRADPGPATSPLTWASVVTHICPRRDVTSGVASEVVA